MGGCWLWPPPSPSPPPPLDMLEDVPLDRLSFFSFSLLRVCALRSLILFFFGVLGFYVFPANPIPPRLL